MKRLLHIFLVLLFLVNTLHAQEALIIDHTCTNLGTIPAAWIDSVQVKMKLHYAHTSHGSQLITGLEMIENNFPGYDFAVLGSALPVQEGSFCIFDGQEGDTYITPDEYWSTASGMQKTASVITNNTNINVSMWSWCGEMSPNDLAEVQRYIDSIEVLEARFPQVQFVYMTGHTDGTGAASGDNLRASNNQLREYCIANGKILFDFEDIESWDPDGNYYEDASDDCAWCTDWCNSHPEECLPCSSCAHSHCYNCYQKGKALWWMMARLAGWSGESQGDYIEQFVGICDGDSLFVGGVYQGTAGVYYDTLVNSAGNDSVIATILTLNPTYLIQKSVSICEGEDIFLGGANQTEPGTYQDIYTSVHGCDSIVETTLTVHPVYTTQQSMSICEGESIFVGGANQTEPGTYQDVYTSIHGCDSIVETELKVYRVHNTQQSISICEGDSIYLEGAYQKTSGVYHDSFLSSEGCDSSIVTELEVYIIDPSVSAIDNTLHAPSGYDYYQWIDCNTDEPIPGEINSSFTATENGSYSVEISQNGCMTISDCFSVTAVGINKSVSTPDIYLYPNPVSDVLYIDMGKQYLEITVTIRNVNGQSISDYKYANERFVAMNVKSLSKGIYLIYVILDNDTRVLRMVKAN